MFPKGKKGKVTASAIISVADTVAASIRALDGKKISMLGIPKGTPSETNPYMLVKNFILCRKGTIAAGEDSFITLFNDEVKVPDETDLVEEITVLTSGS